MKSVIRFAAVAFLLMMPLALTACNTTRGAGKDIERTGEKLQDATR